MQGTIMSVNDLARYLRISARTVRQLVAEKVLPYSRVGRRILFRRDVIDKFLRQSGQA